MVTDVKVPVKLGELVAEVSRTLEKLPVSGPSNDLALALQALNGIEKSVRKLRAQWTASLVQGAAQGQI